MLSQTVIAKKTKTKK